MHTDDLKKLNERFYDQVFGNRNVHAIDVLLSDDFVDHIPLPGQGPGKQGVKDALQQLLDAFPDLRFDIETQIAEGDTVCALARMTGTHRKEFLGIPATNRSVSVEAIDMSRVRDGKFVEHWGFFDSGALLAQLGVQQPG